MQFINPRIDRTSPSPRSTPRKHFKNARREWICRFDPRSIGGTRCGTINKMYPGSVCLGGGLCAPTNIRIFSRDTGQLIIITIPRMHTLHVFLSLRTRVCVCGSGSAPPTWRNVEWFCTLTARFSDLSPSPSPSLSLSRVLSSLPSIEIYGTCQIEPLLELSVKRPDCWIEPSLLALGQSRVSPSL